MEPTQHESPEPQTPTSPALPKFSRYRSVRRATVNSKLAPPPIPEPMPEIKRSMSRYRKGRPTNPPGSAPPLPANFPSNIHGAKAGHSQDSRPNGNQSSDTEAFQTRARRAYSMPKRSQTAPVSTHGEMVTEMPTRVHPVQRSRKNTYKSQTDTQADLFENDAQREAYAILNGEVDRQKKLRVEQQEREHERRRIREEEDRKRMQKIEEDERAKKAKLEEADRTRREEEERMRQEVLERERIKAAEKEAARARKQAERDRKQQASIAEKEKKKQASLKSPERTKTPPEAGGHDYRLDDSPDRFGTTPKSRKRGVSNPAPRHGDHLPKIDEKPPQLILGFDAPVSASNAGTRKVLVKLDDAETQVSVTPQSTCADVLHEAINALEANFNPARSVLTESFKSVGLERPLRRYERIRDIMNSWDYDAQNCFLILPPEMGYGAALEVKDAPSQPPEEISVNIHYSSKPGSWDKRWMTLRSDGQVLVSKQPGVDQKNICHMTDFDIYMPTEKRLKKIKPPKKFCFAIKSQQKSAMFLNTDNFVHFISTKDKEQAQAWHKAVQSWRSWYLMHEMGMGAKEAQAAASPPRAHHQRSLSAESQQPYQLGSFKPFLGDDIFGSLLIDSVPSRPTEPSPVPLATANNSQAPTSTGLSRKLTKSAADKPTILHADPNPPSTENDPFAVGGLLGRTYSQRQRAMQERADQQHNTLLQDQMLSGHKPLVDLTPQYREPPQHAGRGRGFAAATSANDVPSGGLVNFATGREEAYGGAFFNSGAIGSGGGGAMQRSGTVRSTRSSRYGRDNNSKAAGRAEPVPDLPSAFTGGGLLASAGEGVGAGRMGRGFGGAGNRSGGEPLLDMSEARQYIPGSLLDSVERWEDSEGIGREKVVVDRVKRAEGTVRVGEGV